MQIMSNMFSVVTENDVSPNKSEMDVVAEGVPSIRSISKMRLKPWKF